MIEEGNKVRGIKHLSFDVTFPKDVEILDYGPKTEWADDKYKVTINGEVRFEIPIPIGGITLPIKFKYKWVPKIGKVISSPKGNEVNFKFNKVDVYLDGEKPLYFMISAPKDKPVDKITYKNIKVLYDLAWQQDVQAEPKDKLQIKVII
jgi:hypothetical protein